MEWSQYIHKWAKVLIVLALILVIGGIADYYFKAQYQMVISKEREKTAMVANHLELYLNAHMTALQFLAEDPDVSSLKPEVMRSELARTRKTLGFLNVGVVNQEGEVLAQSTTRFSSDKSNDDESMRRVWQGDSVISNRIGQEGLEKAQISLRAPIRDDRGGVKAVLSAALPITEISRMVYSQTVAPNQYIFVMDNNTQFIHHPKLKEIFPEKNTFERYHDAFFSKSSGEVSALSLIDHVEKLYIFTSLDKTQWRVVMAIPVKDIYVAVFRVSFNDLAMVALLVACIALLYRVLQQERIVKENRESLRMERFSCVNQMIAGLVHEIRNPLTAIKGFIQLIERKGDRPPNPNYLEIMLSEIERIEKLIKEFQILARPLKTVHFEKIEMTEIIRDVMLLMESQAVSKNITMEFYVDLLYASEPEYSVSIQPPSLGGVSYPVMGDEVQVKQVLINLLRNAIEASYIDGKITITLSAKEDMVIAAVKDNGVGIPEETLQKIGTPFFTTKETGTGLGLSVCYTIIENHHGSLQIHSTVGEGTAFTIRLPQIPTMDF